ncbi:SMI1/KNR4 family protein [Allochromatium vinosum]|uniref:SMI1/KNR4 family protein n=1 Tax=Allochromatium vinosum TaxID=1049 RepID=UPI0030B858F6
MSGGGFGFSNVFSADPDGEFYLPEKNKEAAKYLPSGLLAFSDDFAGGYYVLSVTDGRAEDPVLYWNSDGGLIETEFDDVLEFVVRYAYEPA